MESFEMGNHASYIDLMCHHDEIERESLMNQFGYYKDDNFKADTSETWLDEPHSCKCSR